MDIESLYLNEKSLSEISNETGIPISTIRYRLKKLGILRTRKEGSDIVAKQGRRAYWKGKRRVMSEEWKNNISKGKIGKGKGYSLKPSGYVEITMGENKGRLQHVVIIEERIGRRLYHHECVHHIDFNKSNNSDDNLTLMSKSDHSKLHCEILTKNKTRDSKGRFTKWRTI